MLLNSRNYVHVEINETTPTLNSTAEINILFIRHKFTIEIKTFQLLITSFHLLYGNLIRLSERMTMITLL